MREFSKIISTKKGSGGILISAEIEFSDGLRFRRTTVESYNELFIIKELLQALEAQKHAKKALDIYIKVAGFYGINCAEDFLYTYIPRLIRRLEDDLMRGVL